MRDDATNDQWAARLRTARPAKAGPLRACLSVVAAHPNFAAARRPLTRPGKAMRHVRQESVAPSREACAVNALRQEQALAEALVMERSPAKAWQTGETVTN
jgi:hypothetical protein